MKKSASFQSRVRIVLVHPRNPLNIGASARAMLNFGFEDLYVVAPFEAVWRESKSAMGAAEVLRNAPAVATLAEAVADRTLVVGTSSLSRRDSPRRAISLDELPKLIKKADASKVAVVFGSEKTGLSREDLHRCHSVMRIQTLPSCPSMNLGQAVAVVCYELRRALGGSAAKGPKSAATQTQPASLGDVDRIVAGIEAILGSGDLGMGRARERAMKIRRLFLERPVSVDEAHLVFGVLRDISWRLSKNAVSELE